MRCDMTLNAPPRELGPANRLRARVPALPKCRTVSCSLRRSIAEHQCIWQSRFIPDDRHASYADSSIKAFRSSQHKSIYTHDLRSKVRRGTPSLKIEWTRHWTRHWDRPERDPPRPGGSAAHSRLGDYGCVRTRTRARLCAYVHRRAAVRVRAHELRCACTYTTPGLVGLPCESRIHRILVFTFGNVVVTSAIPSKNSQPWRGLVVAGWRTWRRANRRWRSGWC